MYLNGGLAYGRMKQELFETLDATFSEARVKYSELMADTAQIDAILGAGAERMRDTAQRVLNRVRTAIGKVSAPVAVR